MYVSLPLQYWQPAVLQIFNKGKKLNYVVQIMLYWFIGTLVLSLGLNAKDIIKYFLGRNKEKAKTTTSQQSLKGLQNQSTKDTSK